MELDHIATLLALTMGVSWASGINLYAAIFMLGMMGSTGNIDLPASLEVLQNPMVIMAAGVMYMVEFFADKVPGVDMGWDAIHTFIRIPAGAMMAAGAVGEMDPAMGLVAGILGGGLTAATHAAKSGTRALVNTSPEPFSNWGVSLAEDVAVFGGLWTALNHPTLFVVFMVIFIILLIWLLPRLWRGIKKVFATLKSWIAGNPKQADSVADNPQQEHIERSGNAETYRHVETENKS